MTVQEKSRTQKDLPLELLHPAPLPFNTDNGKIDGQRLYGVYTPASHLVVFPVKTKRTMTQGMYHDGRTTVPLHHIHHAKPDGRLRR
ncbi:hypothetical protein HH682_05780 [Rosenbergiella sp. S61]|uniref:Uncharacterized protein n=1 Tax=Rosenbergiella gaditana TaxID=2726987 RepID=A0ABS5SV18_9GAMM|nr:hypothetical protein [Rosenbergiella gaditana]